MVSAANIQAQRSDQVYVHYEHCREAIAQQGITEYPQVFNEAKFTIQTDT